MKDNLAKEVVMYKNSNAVKCDWSTLESSSLVSALKGNAGVRRSCFHLRLFEKLRLIYICFNEPQSTWDQRCCKSIFITTSAKYLTSEGAHFRCNGLNFHLSQVWLHVDVCCSQQSWPNMMKSQVLDICCNKREKNLSWSFYFDFCRWTRHKCYWQIIFQGLKRDIVKWLTRC